MKFWNGLSFPKLNQHIKTQQHGTMPVTSALLRLRQCPDFKAISSMCLEFFLITNRGCQDGCSVLWVSWDTENAHWKSRMTPTQSCKEGDRQISWAFWAATLVKLVNYGFSERPYLKICFGEWWKDKNKICIWSSHAHTDTHS